MSGETICSFPEKINSHFFCLIRFLNSLIKSGSISLILFNVLAENSMPVLKLKFLIAAKIGQ